MNVSMYRKTGMYMHTENHVLWQFIHATLVSSVQTFYTYTHPHEREPLCTNGYMDTELLPIFVHSEQLNGTWKKNTQQARDTIAKPFSSEIRTNKKKRHHVLKRGHSNFYSILGSGNDYAIQSSFIMLQNEKKRLSSLRLLDTAFALSLICDVWIGV